MTAMVCRLTDEELDALTDGAPSPVGSPFLDRLDPDSRARVRQSAQRSLMVRRLLQPDGDLRADLVQHGERGGTVPGRATGLVGVVLDLRAGAPVVLVLHRWAGAARDGTEDESALSRYLHVVSDTLVTEDVSPEGVHTFGLFTWSELSRLVEEFVVPPGAERRGPAAARAFTDPGDTTRLLAALGHPGLLAETFVKHALASGPPQVRTLALGSRGCFSGSPTPAGTRFRELGADALVQQLVDEVAAARELVAAALRARRAPAG